MSKKKTKARGEGVCIELDSTFRIVADTHQWILESKVKGGWEVEGQGGYFSSLSNLLTWYVGLQLRASNAKSIAELVSALESVSSRLARLVAPIDKAGLNITKGE